MSSNSLARFSAALFATAIVCLPHLSVAAPKASPNAVPNPAPKFGANLLANPDFTTTAKWKAAAGATKLASGGVGGGTALRLNSPGTLSQTVSLPKGTLYGLSTIYINPVGKKASEIQVTLKDGAFEQPLVSSGRSGSKFNLYTFIGPIHVGHASLTLSVKVTGRGYVLIDKASLVTYGTNSIGGRPYQPTTIWSSDPEHFDPKQTAIAVATCSSAVDLSFKAPADTVEYRVYVSDEHGEHLRYIRTLDTYFPLVEEFLFGAGVDMQRCSCNPIGSISVRIEFIDSKGNAQTSRWENIDPPGGVPTTAAEICPPPPPPPPPPPRRYTVVYDKDGNPLPPCPESDPSGTGNNPGGAGGDNGDPCTQDPPPPPTCSPLEVEPAI